METTDEMITIKKSTMMSILNLMSLSAFAMDFKLSSIYRSIELGKTKKYQGKDFTHEWNYDTINEDVNSLFKIHNLIFNAIPKEGESVSECVDSEITNNPEFKELLSNYGAELKDKFNTI